MYTFFPGKILIAWFSTEFAYIFHDKKETLKATISYYPSLLKTNRVCIELAQFYVTTFGVRKRARCLSLATSEGGSQL